MPTFAEIVQSDNKYKSLRRGRRKIGYYEATEQLIIGLAERELGKLLRQNAKWKGEVETQRAQFEGLIASLQEQTERERLRGQLAVEKQKNIFLTMFVYARGLPEWLVTPFSAMRERYFYQLCESDSAADPALLATRPVARDAAAEPGEPQEPVAAPEPTANGTTDEEPPAEDASFSSRIYETLPKPLQVTVDFLAYYVVGLSPTTSALLMVLVVFAMWGYGKWARSSLEESFKYVVAQRDLLKQESADQKKKLDGAKNFEKELAVASAQLKQAKLDLERAQQEVKDVRHEMQVSAKAHKDEVDQVRLNADKTLSGQLAKAEGELGVLKDERDKLDRRVAELVGYEMQIPDLRNARDVANNNARKYENELSTARDDLTLAKNNQRATLALLNGVLKQLDDGLLNTNTHYLDYHQKQFRHTYNLLYSTDAEIYQKLKIRPR